MGRRIKNSNKFFLQSIVLFGFLQGFWIAAGIDPKKVVSGALFPFVERLGPVAIFVFGILPTILLMVTLFYIYRKGRLTGMAAVIMGFVAGITILVSPYLAVGLLICAWLIGFLAVN